MGKFTLVMFACAFLVLIGRVEGYLYKDTAGFLFGGFLGIGFFITGPWWLGQKMIKSMRPVTPPIDESMFSVENANKLIDYIDQRANESVISNNNEWLKRNWHNMSDVEKRSWVVERMNYLKDGIINSHTEGSSFFINAIQTADKEFQRNNIKSA